MRKYYGFTWMAIIAAMLLIGATPVAAQEGAGVFKSEQGQKITPDQQGVIGWEGYVGEYDDNNTDDWWYDTYSYEEESLDPEIRGYYGEEGVAWYNEDNRYKGLYDDSWDENDWYFDTYDDTGDEGFWDF